MLLDIKDGVLLKYYAEEGDSPYALLPEGITEIGKEAFCGCMSIHRVTLSEGITHIAERAFANCYFLSDIRMPESLETIGERAFESCCSLQRIDFPSSMTHIARGAFRGCSALKKVHLPDGLTLLECELFAMCSSLNCVSLPASLRKTASCRKRAQGTFSGTFLLELHLRGGWFEGFARAVNLSTHLSLQALYVQDVSCVPPPFLSIALLTFAQYEDSFSPEIRRNYYAYMRTHAESLYDLCAASEDILHILCREDLILSEDTERYFASLALRPDRLAFLTKHLCRRHLFSGQTFQSCLNIAIEQNLPEITSMLLDYKRMHILQDPNDDLTL